MNTNHASLRCPHCGKPMQFMQLIRKQGGLPELRTFLCENCQTVITTEAQAKTWRISNTATSTPHN